MDIVLLVMIISVIITILGLKKSVILGIFLSVIAGILFAIGLNDFNLNFEKPIEIILIKLILNIIGFIFISSVMSILFAFKLLYLGIFGYLLNTYIKSKFKILIPSFIVIFIISYFIIDKEANFTYKFFGDEYKKYLSNSLNQYPKESEQEFNILKKLKQLDDRVY